MIRGFTVRVGGLRGLWSGFMQAKHVQERCWSACPFSGNCACAKLGCTIWRNRVVNCTCVLVEHVSATCTRKAPDAELFVVCPV